MIATPLNWLHRFVVGMLSKEKSLATGVLLALILWTVTRLVDVVTGNLTIEYDVRYTPAVFADGRKGTKIEVTLTNLSNDTAVSELQVAIVGPTEMVFTNARADASCAFQAPSWGDEPQCDPHHDGIAFTAPMVVPGTEVVLSTLYTVPAGSGARPTVRIKPGTEKEFRLVKPGFRTRIARHETELLLGLLGLAIVVFVVSVAAGISKSDP